jgi:hypothetical protein
LLSRYPETDGRLALVHPSRKVKHWLSTQSRFNADDSVHVMMSQQNKGEKPQGFVARSARPLLKRKAKAGCDNSRQRRKRWILRIPKIHHNDNDSICGVGSLFLLDVSENNR